MDVTPDFGRPPIRTLAVLPDRARALVVALVVALAMAAAPGLFASGGSAFTYVMDAAATLPDGARVVQHMPFIGSVVVSSPVEIPGAAAMDAAARPETLLTEPADGSSLDSAVASTGAPAVWAGGERGRQAVVALIDTGVADVAALGDAVAGEIDFTGSGGGDGYGHGTFMASIIAGRGPIATGVAPQAGILSLKVGDANGGTSLGTILAAMQWLDGPGRKAGIRVAALAMAVEPGTPAADVLDRAADRLASRGLLVITAAGNDGAEALTSPATSRGTFSVGAVDDAGTADRGDDVEADFSGTGPDAAGVAQPDALGSGVSVVGSLPYGSVLAGLASTTDDEGLYRGSGTSMATAVAAGVAALASSARPDLDGRALDAALRAGAGELDAQATVDAALAAPGGNGNGNGNNGNGNGNGGNGNGKGNNGNGNGNGGNGGDVSGSPQSVRWTSVRWTSVRWTGEGWGDTQWGMKEWGSVRWTGRSWAYAGATPQSVRWTSVRWTALSWAPADL